MRSTVIRLTLSLAGASALIVIPGSESFAAKTAAGTSSVSTDVVKKTPWGLSTYFDFQGSSVGDPTRATKPTATGTDSGAPMDFYNSTKLGLKLYENGKLFVNPRWLFQPVKNHDFTILNARAGYQQSNIVSAEGLAGKFSFKKADLHAELPTAKKSRLDRLTMGLGSAQNFEFSNSSPWKLSMDTYFRFYFYNNTLPVGSDLKFGFFPQLSYKISESTTAQFRYEHEFAHDRVYQAEPNYKLRRTYSCLKPMADFAIAKDWNITPYASLSVGDKVSLKSTLWGFEFSGLVF